MPSAPAAPAGRSVVNVLSLMFIASYLLTLNNFFPHDFDPLEELQPADDLNQSRSEFAAAATKRVAVGFVEMQPSAAAPETADGAKTAAAAGAISAVITVAAAAAFRVCCVFLPVAD